MSQTLQTVINWGAAIAVLLTALSTFMHMVGLDQKPWAKPVLRVSNDIVGALKALASLRGGGGDAGGGSAKKSGPPPAAPYSTGPSKPMTGPARVGLVRGFAFALTLVFVLPTAGCGAGALQLIDKASRALAEIPMLLDIVRAAEDTFFAKHPDPATEAKIDRARQEAGLAADALLRASEGVTDLANADPAALTKFQSAWTELQAALRAAHIIGDSGRFSAELGGGAIELPRPLALTRGP